MPSCFGWQRRAGRINSADFLPACRFSHDSIADITSEIDGTTAGKASDIAYAPQERVAPLQFLGTASREQEARDAVPAHFYQPLPREPNLVLPHSPITATVGMRGVLGA